MSSHFRSTRIVLAFVFLLSLYFAYMMLFDPSMLMEIYAVSTFDDMHAYFSMVAGGMLVVMTIGAGLAFLRPLKYASIVTLLILYHFARFAVDLILLARGQIPINLLLPEMVYFILVCVALIRYFPTKPPEPKEEKKEEKPAEEPLIEEKKTPNQDINVSGSGQAEEFPPIEL